MRGHTLVLETRFETPDGTVTLVDCMGRRDGCADLVRLVTGESGRVELRMELVIRCEYRSMNYPEADEARVPKDHPLRPILRIVDEALAALSLEFEGLYAKYGRPSIPPERLLRALLLQAFYSVRSEKQLMEQLQYNLLFRGFVGTLGVAVQRQDSA